MKTLYSLIISFFAIILSPALYGQGAALGSWQDYLSYNNGVSVTAANNLIYCAAGGGVFSYNTADNSIQRFSKVNGLSDVTPSIVRYNSTTNSLIIGYPNGNIDVIQNGVITNIPDLKNSLLQGNKAIYGMCFDNNIAYIGCGQGIMQVDLSQDIILNTYYIGSSGGSEIVYGTAILHDTLYAATRYGIQYAALSNPNLNDYTQWTEVPYQPATPLRWGPYNTICVGGDSLFTNWAGVYIGAGPDTAYVYSHGKWNYFTDFEHDDLNSFQVCSANGKNYLTAAQYGDVYVKDLSNYSLLFGVNTSQSDAAVNPSDVFFDGTNAWVAANMGLAKIWKSNSYTYNTDSIIPPGPFSNFVSSIAVQNNDIYIAPGGYDAAFGPRYISSVGISAYNNGSWHRIITNPDTMQDLDIVTIDPKNSLHGYAGSWDFGIMEFSNNTPVASYGTYTPNGPQVVQGSSNNSRIGGIAFDTSGNVWETNGFASSNFLSVKEANGTWNTFDFSSFIGASPSGIVVSNLLVTQSQAKWMQMYGTGILVYQDNGTFAPPGPSNSILITNETGHGALPSLNVFAMAQDQNGSIWVGTDASVVVFYSPDNVLDGNHDWDAQPVYVQQNGYTQYLMQNQVTTAIAVDGANRKWIGTQGGGAFLMSADGTQQIYNFTAENSPLLSDNIVAIAINQQTGEVFFGTDKGVVSYMGDAIQGDSTYANLFTYPNPVPHAYSGPIAIKGMVTNSDVRITTVSGQIVYHTTSLGGQAIWNGTNFDGKRVDTGVYLVFAISPDGTQTAVGKFLFVN